jgi:peptidoglycan/xylan/chitin deacetylase (PgdA/CDA1 family)
MMKLHVTTSWDDGHPLDLKLANLLQKYDLPGTFYVPLSNPENAVLDKNQLRELSAGFEIGSHTFNHVYLTEIPLNRVEEEVSHGKVELEQLIQRPVNWFAYPGGKYHKAIRDIVGKCGFSGARTNRFMHFELPKDKFQTHTTFIISKLSDFIIVRHLLIRNNLKPLPLYVYVRLMSKSWRAYVCNLFDYLLKKSNHQIFHIWGHSWEIEKFSLWNDIEYIFQHISNRTEVKYVSNGEIATLISNDIKNR